MVGEREREREIKSSSKRKERSFGYKLKRGSVCIVQCKFRGGIITKEVQWKNLYNASSVEQSLHWKELRSWAFGGIVCTVHLNVHVLVQLGWRILTQTREGRGEREFICRGGNSWHPERLHPPLERKYSYLLANFR